jgi:trypsin
MIRILIFFAVASVHVILGQAVPNTKIVGGEDADITEAPYQVSLKYGNFFTCGGSIISKSYILTAAHCVQRQGTYKVRVGSSYSNKEGTLMEVAKITVHPKYGKPLYNNDFALLKLKNPIKEFDSKVKSIALASPDQKLVPGSPAMVTGFGKVIQGGPSAKKLQKAKIPLIDWKDCRARYGLSITEQMLCAGTGKGSCHGK